MGFFKNIRFENRAYLGIHIKQLDAKTTNDQYLKGADMTTSTIAHPRRTLRTKGIKQAFNWLLVFRQRRKLAQLDARALADIGLNQTDVAQELKRPLWDVPAHWRG
jgi:uncharacterized protein YjiS (DUF1127 family)